MTHPDHVVPLDRARSRSCGSSRSTGLTGGLTPAGRLQKAIAAAVERAPELPEWQDAAFVARNRWAELEVVASRAPMRRPRRADLSPMHPARARLAFDELLASQLAIALVRHHNRTARRPRDQGRRPVAASARSPALPFELTPSQTVADRRDRRRHGEARAHGPPAAGRCRQRQDAGRLPRHADRPSRPGAGGPDGADRASGAPALTPPSRRSPRRPACAWPCSPAATARSRRRRRLQGLGRRLDPARGRHACAGAGGRRVRRPRAGGGRRAASLRRASAHGASSKGHAVDLLVMTATPIPRTLMLAAYGDLDVSKLTEKPAGRQPIDTRTIPLERIGEVVDAVGRQIASGRARLLGLPADRGIRGGRPRQCRGALRLLERALSRQGRPAARPAEGRRARGDHGAPSPRARCRSWWPPP